MRIENKSQNQSHTSYNEYKTKFTKTKKQTFLMFISIFFVLLLIFLGFARLMSPDVDISIGEDYNNNETNISEEYNRTGNVDDRLKALQEEDEATVETKTEDDGLVKIPEHKKAAAEQEPAHEDSIVLDEPVAKKQEPHPVQAPQQAPKPQTQTAPTPAVHSTTSAVTARVVVGYYNSPAQADVAKGILQEAGLGVTPHIRQMGSGYTLQVGAYSSKEAANNLANKLLMNNYPARVIVENN